MSLDHMSVRLQLCGLRVLEVSVDTPTRLEVVAIHVCVAAAVPALRVLVSPCARSSCGCRKFGCGR